MNQFETVGSQEVSLESILEKIDGQRADLKQELVLKGYKEGLTLEMLKQVLTGTE